MKYNWNPWEVKNWTAAREEWSNPDLPMVTLGVLNYNRCAELRQTLDVLTRAVKYPHYEVIVIDNGSTDGSNEMIRNEYPSVILHEVGKNLGVSARNIEFDLARGKYLFMFDDDTCPGMPATVLRIVQHMESNPDIAVLSTSYYQPVTGIMETTRWENYRFGGDERSGFQTLFLVEGGSCVRVAALKGAAGFDPEWSGAEGIELALQIYQQDLGVFFCPWFLTLHFVSPSPRLAGRSYRAHRAYVNSRQFVWMIAKHWPITAALPLLTCLILRRILAMVMHRHTATENIRGIFDGFRAITRFARYGPKLSWKQVFAIRRFYLGMLRWA
ncbi:MAG: glycosyltransferase [Bacteroidota bacterium]|nr:glycosyltransferase [Bacteroidota bacterium]MDP4233036.1 glycosyltransferase [Bacteroidota bacterium]MDP4241819.1 glycosyltransferase [Bacteroidota bacterium]MDP4288760.1 glycosyltransferase [Bacteroidota bacterium]